MDKLLAFLDASPTPYHAVSNLGRMLEVRGFTYLRETQSNWSVQPGGRYWFHRNGSALVAFVIGKNFDAQRDAVNVVAAHTDSPCLKVKPLSKKRSRDGMLQVAVETYGGGLWHTWFDRDLGLAGKLVTRERDAQGIERLAEHLVHIDRPILRIPSLAIHLDRSVHEGFKFNTELQLAPLLATNDHDDDASKSMHSSLLKALIGDRENVLEVLSADLSLFDVQKASIGGINGEFIQSARLDNLMLSYCSIQALLDSLDGSVDQQDVKSVILYDNEEVGSESAHGAMSTLMDRLFETLVGENVEVRRALLARSFLISADMAHAVHPNYADKHDDCHRPRMNGGVVIKWNNNQRYATTVWGAARLKLLAAQHAIPLQEFMVRNDSPCGSTIGPMVSAKMGIMTIDLGLPQLSMHSIRELAATADFFHGLNLLKAFFSTSYSRQ